MDLSGLEGLLLSIHHMLAHFYQVAELQLHPAEAKAIADAAANVGRHYDIRTTQKAMDWGALFVALGTVYGPRAVVIANARRQRQPQPQPGPAAADTGWGQIPEAAPEPPLH